MTVPTYAEMIEPLLRVLHERGPLRASEARLAVADRMGLTEEQRSELLPSGAHPRYAHRVGWAQDSTKRHGLTTSETWGTWQLTKAGRALLDMHPQLRRGAAHCHASGTSMPDLAASPGS
ncbi:MAG: winged helix-turn-helix domain-containing protein [Sandaracinus sp.]|nr:winged helix-turn-helix domain-containing protein [Sandaracinus sp.]